LQPACALANICHLGKPLTDFASLSKQRMQGSPGNVVTSLLDVAEVFGWIRLPNHNRFASVQGLALKNRQLVHHPF